MNELSDQQLLLEYAEQQSEAAFSELVRRHIDLVYSAALRMVCESHSAEDVTQAVFVALAQNASSLAKRPVLSGWLHCAARNLAAKAVRTEVRRRAREQEAAAMNLLASITSEPSWDDFAPHLDAALSELSEPERDAVLLRYFEQKSASEMAGIVGISDEAAQKRVSRAVERLRRLLAKRGVAVGSAGLVALISANAVQSAPFGLAATVSASAVLGSVACTSPVIAATKIIAMTALQKAFVTATFVLLAGTGIYEAHQAAQLREKVAAFEQQQVPLTEQIQQLQQERDAAKRQLASVRAAENQQQTNNMAELLRLRGMAGVARRALAEEEQLRAQLARQATESTNNPVSGAMADALNEALEQQVEGRLSRLKDSLHLTPDQVEAAREILLRQAEAMSAGMQQAFSGKYDKEEIARLSKRAGNTDAQIKALLTPDQQSAFPAYQREEAEHNAGLAANNDMLQMQSSLSLTSDQMNQAYAALYDFNLSQLTGGTKQQFTNSGDAMQWALEQKVKVMEPILTPAQLENYRKQVALQAKLMQDIANKMGAPATP